ncbi:Smr/MutS family protein [Afifella pfennigii]|uniref:Smr/MutS family protein n=1 Tax=Afifella pfennigii TaxID=209897 RepID=UPI000555986F|nr:Smr/MutS family protein [Afifella pfennigii]
MTRRPSLSAEDWALWEKVRRSVRPLRRRAVKPGPADRGASKGTSDGQKAAAESAPVADSVVAAEDSRLGVATARRLRPAAPPPAATRLQPRERRDLGRGMRAPEARIDLHGMTQARAHDRLLAFLREGQRRGITIVLVITGKGGPDGRGVLREMVPRWLREPAFAEIVVAYDGAARRHGGEGALYVRLRRSGNRRRTGGA